MYSPYLNQFIQPDTIVPDPRIPADWNKYTYVRDNPINYIDPLGLCANCYVFFFPGAGNYGDANADNKMDKSDLGSGESRMVEAIGDRTGATVEVVYPYGPGIGGKPPVRDPISGFDDNRNLRDAVWPSSVNMSHIPFHKAQEIIARLLGDTIELCYPASYGENQFDNNSLNITFIGYSGGGQMAYSTAQSLKGKLFVDNLIMFGSTYRAHNGLGNIGHLWNLVSEQDEVYYQKYAGPLFSKRWETQNRYTLGLYSNKANASFCTLLGDENPYVHNDADYSDGGTDYFGRAANMTGINCYGYHSNLAFSREQAAQLNLSRLEFNLQLIVLIIEGKIE